MKNTQTTRSTTYTTRGWKQAKNGNNLCIDFETDHSKAFQKEIDQTLFPARKIDVKELPTTAWDEAGASCPVDLIRFDIAAAISKLCDVLDWSEELEAKGKRVRFEVAVLDDVAKDIAHCQDLATLYGRASTENHELLVNTQKLTASLRERLVNSLRRAGLDV